MSQLGSTRNGLQAAVSARLVLASASPRRRELLASLGLAPVIRPSDTDESPRRGEPPRDYVERVAREKAAAAPRAPGEIVLAADTAVVLGDEILGKPRDARDARRMLRALSGRAHQVMTGVCVLGGRAPRARRAGRPGGAAARETVVTTEVHFAELTAREIAWYVGTGEPDDKAGAYAIQGAGGAFVRAVVGSASNVVGLPLFETLDLLARAGLRLPWSSP